MKHVNKLIERCPDLPLSTMICPTDMPDSKYNESNNKSSLFQKTILQQSLEVLNHYLIHNDVVNVIQRFPSKNFNKRCFCLNVFGMRLS